MKRFFIYLLIIHFLGYGYNYSCANNLTLQNVFLSDQNTTLDYTMINFGISWHNSWRTSTLESNWDAAWVFAKFRKKWTTVWNHATINYVDGTAANDGHTEPVGATITTPPDGKGIFIYRSADGIGNVNFPDAKIRWNYGIDGIADNDSVEICLFAIEMVYIPQGSFYLGDGGTGSQSFRAGATANTPFLLSSETGLVIGDDATTKLYASGAIGSNGPISDNFPKGYRAFYCMKHEITQQQYVDFLNKLTRTQQGNRSANNALGVYTNNNTTTPTFRCAIRVMVDPGGASPREYGLDLNNNGIYNQNSDGGSIACNYLNLTDGLAYADWAGLRPMTELEYEKICRGGLYPVADEYAWGNTNFYQTSSIANAGTNIEGPSNNNANNNSMNNPSVQGPMRAGCFARPTTNRESAGAGYFGVLDMSGNLWERVVTIGNDANGRIFTGLHGNGVLTAAGAADVPNWSANPLGYSLKGGSWGTNVALRFTISDRLNTAWNDNNRYNSVGFRCVRTAP